MGKKEFQPGTDDQAPADLTPSGSDTFRLDTSGSVRVRRASDGPDSDYLYGWRNLDPFAQGYTEALCRGVWESFGQTGKFGFSDLAPETLARIIEDCNRAQNFISGLGLKIRAVEGRNFYNGRAADQLTGAWRAAFPPETVTLGDDGKVRFAVASSSAPTDAGQASGLNP